VLFLGVLANGLDLLGLDFNVKAAVQGVVLLVALVLAYTVAQRARAAAERKPAMPGRDQAFHIVAMGTSCRWSDGDSRQTCESSGDFSCESWT